MRGQRDPQLRGVQPGLVGQRFLGVRDAVARGHQVDLAGADDLLVAQAVAVQHLAFEHPGEGLQRRMRVRPHAQAPAGRKVRRPGVVQKTPGADGALEPRRQRACHGRTTADVGGACGDAQG
jgi:hypothetical protein